MLNDIWNVLHRSRDTLLQDAIGLASLVVMLGIALHLPSAF